MKQFILPEGTFLTDVNICQRTFQEAVIPFKGKKR